MIRRRSGFITAPGEILCGAERSSSAEIPPEADQIIRGDDHAPNAFGGRHGLEAADLGEIDAVAVHQRLGMLFFRAPLLGHGRSFVSLGGEVNDGWERGGLGRWCARKNSKRTGGRDETR